MRNLIFLLLVLALLLPTVARASTSTARHRSGKTQYAFLGLKHSNKAKKQKKAKKSKKSKSKSSKKAPRAKPSR